VFTSRAIVGWQGGKVVMREVGIFPGNRAVFVPRRNHPMPVCTRLALREVAYPCFTQVLAVVAYIQSSPPLAKLGGCDSHTISNKLRFMV
jgi:hypothetical protein